MKRFKAKVDKGILILLIAILTLVLVTLIIQKSSLLILGIILIAFFLLLNFSLLTRYDITEEKKLLIKSGFIYFKKIDVESIKSIKRTNNLISSPAPSVDRIEIFFNKYDSVLISPKDQREFISELKRINNNIVCS